MRPCFGLVDSFVYPNVRHALRICCWARIGSDGSNCRFPFSLETNGAKSTRWGLPVTEADDKEFSERLIQPTTSRLFLFVMVPCLVYAGVRYHIVAVVPLVLRLGKNKKSG